MKRLSLLLLLLGSLNALPQEGAVSSGIASITHQSEHCQITQSTDKVIINWDSFSIGATEKVSFAQPSSHSVALNRVIGKSPSEIFGALSANGHVFLINPHGIIFAPGAQVNTAGFVASTLTLLDHQFLEESYQFKGLGGSVINRGTIRASDGSHITLIGGSVINDGRLEVSKGIVNLASGSEVSLALSEGGSLFATVTKESLSAHVANNGTIQATGGTVVLSALSTSAVLETVVNNSGVIEARSLAKEEGRVILRGGCSGVVENGGKIDVSGKNKGGTVTLTGEYVASYTGGAIVATGKYEGGEVMIGYENDTLAKCTLLSKDAFIDVSAPEGNAGIIRIKSSEYTLLHGTLKAESPKGRGGYIETLGVFTKRGTVSVKGKRPDLDGSWIRELNAFSN